VDGQLRGLRSLPLRAPRVTLLLIVALTVPLAWYARSLRVEGAIADLLPAHDEARAYYDDIRTVFGSDEATLVGVFANDVFTPEILAAIDRVSTRLAAIDGVREVLSLTTAKGVDSDELGLRVGRLLQALPDTPAAAAAFRDTMLANPLYAGTMVTRDGTATGILVLYDVMSESEFARRRLGEQVAEAVAELGPGVSVAVTGLQTLKVSGTRLMQRDLRRLLPLALFVVALVLVWAFRTRRGVFVTLAAALLGAVWTGGAMAVAGLALNIGTVVLPPLVVAISVTYAIHIVSRYYQEARPGRTPRDTVESAIDEVALPLGIAALTTALGFGILAFSPIGAIRGLGIGAALGVGFALVTTFGFIPAVLMLMPQLRDRPPTHHRWTVRVLDWCGRVAVAHRRAVLAVTAIVCVVSAWGALRVRVETDYLNFFGPRSRVRLENERIAASLGGTQPIYLGIDGPGPNSLRRLETLRALYDLQAFVRQQPGVDSVISLADFVALAQRALNPDGAGPLPATQEELEQLLLFLNPEDVHYVVNGDGSRGNVIVRTRLSRSADVAAFVQTVEAEARRRFPGDVRIRATGVVPLLSRSADELAHAELAGLTQMLVTLLVLMSLLYLSVRGGLLSLIPNIVPVIVLFGGLGWCGIPINVTTSMIALIAIAVTLADTTHYLSALNVEIRRAGTEEGALPSVARVVGRPIMFTSIALTAGFLVFGLSSFEPIRQFGLLAGVAMLLALAADLLLTPALAAASRVVTLWDLLRMRLGSMPHTEIPLFAGLRPFQAKLVVLMGQLATVPPGTCITRRGEMKRELYVLLRGRAAVRAHDGEPIIRFLERGDVIGEMGLVRDRPRSAEVTAVEPTEYLVLDAAFLTRIRRRYPHIAASLFLNLARILSDRLENTTEQLAATPGPEAAPPHPEHAGHGAGNGA